MFWPSHLRLDYRLLMKRIDTCIGGYIFTFWKSCSNQIYITMTSDSSLIPQNQEPHTSPICEVS